MSKITIDGKEYRLKQTIRAIFLWEQISGKVFQPVTTLDNYLYFYCMLLANNPDFMQWEEFLDALDDNPRILVQISAVLAKQANLDRLMDSGDPTAPEDKKKD